MATVTEPAAWRYLSGAPGAKWTVQKFYPGAESQWPGYTVEPLYTADALATARAEGRAEGMREAIEQAEAKIDAAWIAADAEGLSYPDIMKILAAIPQETKP